MAVKLSPIWVGTQFFNSAGNVLSGGKINTYLAGTTTTQSTFTDSTGVTPNANPIILDSTGRYSSQIWLTTGINYKFVLTDSNNNTILTEDNLTGINDTASSGVSEWGAVNATPTFVSGTSFTVPGNLTTTFATNARVKSTINAGSVYSTVTSSSFSSPNTTVNLLNDSTNLDNTLSAVSISILGTSDPSVPANINYPVALKGQANNSLASAGYVGEIITNSGSAASWVNNTPANITSISVTAGDWDIWGVNQFSNTNAGTTCTLVEVSINTTSATIDGVSQTSVASGISFAGNGTQYILSTPVVPLQFNATTTVYLVGQAAFSSTQTTSGTMWARRRR